MLSSDLAVLQAPMFDGDAFDAGALGEDGFVPAEVGVGWRHVAQAFMVTLGIIVFDEGLDLGFEVAGQEVVFEQDAVCSSSDYLSRGTIGGASMSSGLAEAAVRLRSRPARDHRHQRGYG